MSVLTIPPEVFEIGILNQEYHSRLLLDLERHATVAGIPPAYVWSRLSLHCEEAEVGWVRNLRASSTAGLCCSGALSVPVENKMMAITGACLRNYVDARMMTVQAVLSRLKNDAMPVPTVLLIPNFYLKKHGGGDIAQWQSSSLLGLLYSRLAAGLKTVIYVECVNDMGKDYGSAFMKHINAHYLMV